MPWPIAPTAGDARRTQPIMSSNWKKLLQSGKIHDPIQRDNSKKRKRDEAAQAEKAAAQEKSKKKNSKVSKIHEGNVPVNGVDSNVLTSALALDCEMVGVGDGGFKNALARVSIVNEEGECVFDTFVQPRESITDYRTAVSGIRPRDIKGARDVVDVQNEVATMLEGKRLVGHGLSADLKALMLQHPKQKLRDTAEYKPFRRANGAKESLKNLAKLECGIDIQQGEHSSVSDAYANMRLFQTVEDKWEKEIARELSKKKVKAPYKPQLSDIHYVKRRIG
jgi:RNA exonuclease 4